ncbi:histone PARylation factor 1 isoform X2 [Apis cerana]|uniref:histone PARylation factor 1 isoform X2 n=1 Tax=Apis cerana TaxID=7461 RepID=UPI0007E2D6B8|nr:histone PARylation factor 1 isoform X2 [Apis cerana]XP_061933935.1 histone PARylation factor 1 isoform X2 [Apis cerana]XP_061933936.1 histone PARylation factor 1 isoform X2 [Apis cerana]XP_061933938.1 histone PARylation factor 1 isoform X2 [Apis cerana]XP_061933939.1 histone PARylation factor 1 isoform X2 [Apis cerana]XP_061933940.1 histone PARylation factor 1 isoform X2 [Apis cerana]
MSNDKEEQFRAYIEDRRIPCRYGTKCYQKNAIHLEKYKHPPTKETEKKRNANHSEIRKKRKKKDNNEISNNFQKKKIKKEENKIINEDLHSVVITGENNIIKNNNIFCEIIKQSEDLNHTESIKNTNNLITITSLLDYDKINIENDIILKKISNNAKIIISQLFLTEMPEDFFQLYEFCKNICENDPLNALNHFHLQLVGPYDVFKKEFMNAKVENKEALLKHWRYYYDPPEFQTIIKDNNKDGLHFGYWRDDISKHPVFVAKNKAAINCIIEPVAENIFGTLDVYFEEKLKLATPFEKTRITMLHQKLKSFAKEKKITLEKKTANMQDREKKIVTRAFHKAGIVVPYNKKTQLGYRDLAITDNELQKLLKEIECASTPEVRKKSMSKLEEIIRLATIAADECDFGTVLELGHDLFSSGISFVQSKALNLMSLAYNLLQKPQFLKIAQVHLKNRSKSLDLNVIVYD